MKTQNKLRIISLNIHGFTGKTENRNFIKLCNDHDIIFINEVKHTYPTSIPGFKSLRSKLIPEETNRGGVIVMIKQSLWSEICNISIAKDQVWFSLQSTPEIIFGAIYIAPSDSPYYNPNSYALIQEHCTGTKRAVILGDLNARMANLKVFDKPDKNITYTENIDQSTNENGKITQNIMKQLNITPVNHLIYKSKIYKGNLTFKRKNKWISQLDWAMVSTQLIPYIVNFDVNQQISLPTDHAPIVLELQLPENSNQLEKFAKNLGQEYTIHQVESPHCKPPIKMPRIDLTKFQNILPNPDQFDEEMERNMTTTDMLNESIADTVYKCIKESTLKIQNPEYVSPLNSTQRWRNILNENDSKKLWSAINWKGKWDKSDHQTDKPSDKEFCNHFEELLNPIETRNIPQYQPITNRYIPVLDDEIQPQEVFDCIQNLKSTKAPGPDGIPPGILKYVSDNWTLMLTKFFNYIFSKGYPSQWEGAKVFTIYKKGEPMDPGNYRGITIMSALAKLYDMVLNKRFNLWYKPNTEQAGAQKGRNCEEHILTVRLLIDIARKTKKTLYITYIDYEKAYDKINRNKLFERLDNLGCGTKYLKALQQSTSSTGYIGTQKFETSSGVRQGGGTSCSTFVCHIDPTINTVSETGPDSWLENLHILLYMDDTVIFATSREKMIEKLNKLKIEADEIGMKIHPTKSKYQCVNTEDRTPIVLQNITIRHTESYVYLGATISNNPISVQVKTHISQKQAHIMKFYSFLSKNSDAPFIVKKKVWESALRSAIFYGSETWMTRDLKATESPYLSTIKQMLGVRQTTCNELALIELGIGNAKSYVKDAQCKFLDKIMKRDSMTPVQLAINLAIKEKTESGRILTTLKNHPPTFTQINLQEMKQKVIEANTTKRKEYLSINPQLKPNEIYHCQNVLETHRRAYTRMRLGSHKLKIETGRWARIPREQRLCQCREEIQTEEHVILKCSQTEHLRINLVEINSCNNIAEVFQKCNPETIAPYIYNVLKYTEQ